MPKNGLNIGAEHIMNENYLIDIAEYEELFPPDSEFAAWVAECERVAAIHADIKRDRFLFEQDDEHDEFSPFNTSNS